MRVFGWILAAWMMTSTALAADYGASPVRRTSTDRESDLLDALIRQSRFADAIRLCETKLSGSAGESLDRARWTVGLSRARSAELLASGTLSDDQLTQCGGPVTELLESYGDSEFRVFLEFQQIEALRSACFQDCVSASINGPQSDDSHRAVARGAKFVRESEILLKEVRQQRVKTESSPSGATSPTASDLGELSQRLQVNIVQTMLAISDVFVEQSEDQRDAATKALRYAESATESLPAGSDGWTELQLLRIEAILRTGNTSLAMEAFQSLPQANDQSQSLARIALRLRLGLAFEQWASVSRQLQTFYASDARTAPLSFEMDLVRLRLLLRLKSLAPEEVQQLGYRVSDLDSIIRDWIDIIASRNGEYERRRAEALVLRELKSSLGTDATSTKSVDPSIVATQGEDWLRRGDMKRAGELLAAAALADTDSNRAMNYATKAAAAYMADNDSIKAASILYRTAMQHPSEPRSPMIAVQAATLLGQTKQDQYSSQIETMLRESITTWPIEGPVAAARTWLIESLKQQERTIDAAEVATLNFESKLDEKKRDEVVSLWQLASTNASMNELETLSQRFQEAFSDTDLSVQSLARECYLASAAFALDQVQLKTLNENLSTGLKVPISLLRFRTNLQTTPELQNVDERWQGSIEIRLMNDAITNSSVRVPVAKLIESWPGVSSATLYKVQRLAWLGQLDQARAAARKLADASTTPGETIREIAAIFEGCDDKQLRREAVVWLDELASGLPRGSDDWHDAKIRAAQLLAFAGETDEAKKRVRYILLTQPPEEEELRHRYDSIAKQGL